ncbi:MAG: PAS domain-containing sensor histidine kinase [Candidatus Altiarchaeota archaeon]|nr:PAS domain-containing sensor histidine kinase [Candidatus Altiarchaeota archaeon]
MAGALSRDIVEGIPASILVFDKGMRLISANKNFYTKTGKSRKDVMGKTVYRVFYPILDARRMGLVDKIKDVFNTGEPSRGDRLSYRSNLFFYKVNPIRDETNEVKNVMLVMEDITEVTKLEQEIIEANKKLMDANKKLKELDKMKDEFLSTVSHELKTPLTPIKTYLELILDEDIGKINEEQRKGLEISLRRAEHLKRLIDDIVDVSRMESKKMKFYMENIDLRNIIENAVRDMKLLANEKQIKILENLPTRPVYVKADEIRMAQVFSNLIDNSIKFSANGGKITINVKKERGNLSVNISDTGPGIPKKHHKKIFEKFYQVDSSTSRAFGGTGLGLPICKSIIEKHGGDIWVESKVGEGSTLHFTLPAI